jgi:hypothetical protein
VVAHGLRVEGCQGDRQRVRRCIVWIALIRLAQVWLADVLVIASTRLGTSIRVEGIRRAEVLGLTSTRLGAFIRVLIWGFAQVGIVIRRSAHVRVVMERIAHIRLAKRRFTNIDLRDLRFAHVRFLGRDANVGFDLWNTHVFEGLETLIGRRAWLTELVRRSQASSHANVKEAKVAEAG